MAKDLFIDVETFSSVDIKTSGAYKYIESDDFEVLIVGYSIDDGPVKVVDLAMGEELPEEFEEALFDENCKKHAHNATFERLSFRRIGYDIPIEQWYCTAVKAAYCGLPFSLDEVSKKLDIKNKKLDTGKALIKYFSCPCKPTKANGMSTRNYPESDLEKWEQYKEYNKYDVLAEKEIYDILSKYEIPEFERQLYILDQKINDRGIEVDMELATNAIVVDETYTNNLMQESINISGLQNPNSPLQLKEYIYSRSNALLENLSENDAKYMDSPLGASINLTSQSTTKESVNALLNLDAVKLDKDLVTILENRQKLSRSSVKKYYAMINCAMKDNRVRGTFQFYGANRTGRWAGRLLQLQNLSKNHLSDIDLPRRIMKTGDWQLLEMMYDDVSDILSQLVRTALIAKNGYTFAVADFSAIEARVVSWLADEKWRIDVFNGDGKIYEAAAARMFNVPISMVTKGSDLRAKAKNAELALGYQGSLGAMKRMGGDKMGMSDAEMMSIVKKWRDANPKIVELWAEIEECAHEAVRYRRTVIGGPKKNLIFKCDQNNFMIVLPSGHTLFYRNPTFVEKTIGRSKMKTTLLCYEGIVQETKQWGLIDTYGGKLTENIVQAISRDLLGYSMLQLDKNGFAINMHVHDEVISEVSNFMINANIKLEQMEKIMGTPPDWAYDLPLNADGYITKFYKKD